MRKFLNTALKSMALEIPHKSVSQLTNSSLLLSSRNKSNRTKTVATTCFLDCLTLMMKALYYFRTQVSLYNWHSQHPKKPEFSAYVLLPNIPIFSPVIFIFAYYVRLCFTQSHKMIEFLFFFHSVHITGEPHPSQSSEGWPHMAWMWHLQYWQWCGLMISLNKRGTKFLFIVDLVLAKKKWCRRGLQCNDFRQLHLANTCTYAVTHTTSFYQFYSWLHISALIVRHHQVF